MEGSSVNLSAEFARVQQSRDRCNLSKIGRSIIAFLAGSSEPKVQRISDNSWRVYDPIRHQTLYLSSEKEVRMWLEQRYHF
ncbi:hypothetical protein H6F67_07045 [Microcoleus sp. FACHB-1515]|uniref:hypothetical protein n=1 Tax=Cyanophyceae TaxID=3028117 RepID=UPI0016870B02|nr:hypothetical protein [Microcoleus sp. FACHB-1515]MBD2089607.1 hypothetical protein [Microcoleus sp. FACHB-1515]